MSTTCESGAATDGEREAYGNPFPPQALTYHTGIGLVVVVIDVVVLVDLSISIKRITRCDHLFSSWRASACVRVCVCVCVVDRWMVRVLSHMQTFKVGSSNRFQTDSHLKGATRAVGAAFAGDWQLSVVAGMSGHVKQCTSTTTTTRRPRARVHGIGPC